MGLEDDASFLYSVLQVGPAARNVSMLSSQQSEQFSRWIRDLFETHGIRDEPMSSCPPQEFYLLVPTLFQQVILAFSRGVLDGEALKSGIERKCHESLKAKAFVETISSTAGSLSRSVSDLGH